MNIKQEIQFLNSAILSNFDHGPSLDIKVQTGLRLKAGRVLDRIGACLIWDPTCINSWIRLFYTLHPPRGLWALEPPAVVGYPGSPPLLSSQGNYSSSEEGVFKSLRRWHNMRKRKSQCTANAMNWRILCENWLVVPMFNICHNNHRLFCFLF